MRQAIVCIGAMNLDRKAMVKGRLVMGTSNPVTVSESCGGVGRNIAENLARLGCEVSMLSCIGDDPEGRYLVAELERLGIGTSTVRTLVGERTGTYTAVLDERGEMAVALANMDINDCMTPELLAEQWPRAESRPAFMLLDTNFPADCLAYAIARCREEGIRLFIDPVSTPKATKLPERLEGVEAILPNRDEAETLSGVAITAPADCAEACARIHARGVRQVYVTLGEQGVYASLTEGDALIPALPVSVVDATGAGDALAAGLLYGIASGEAPLDACRLGIAAAAITLRTASSVAPDLNSEHLSTLKKEFE